MSCRFTIYCVTNTVNGKRYVGQTSDTVEVRWKAHVASSRNKGGCRVFCAAIRKYGAAAFVREILEVVATQSEADAAETKWISAKESRVPNGYNLTSGGGSYGRLHEESKRLIAKASSERLRKMSPEERAAYFRTNIHVWTPERKTRQRERMQSEQVRENVRSGQKKFWADLSPEEKTRRVRHQQSGISPERKSARVRDAWARMTPEARKARVQKAAAGVIASKTNPAHSKKMSEWQTVQAKLRTPEQRREMVLKSWATRRAKYGDDGVKRMKTSEEYSASTAQGWANMTPEARSERIRKTQEGRRKAKEARAPRLVRINLFTPAIQ